MTRLGSSIYRIKAIETVYAKFNFRSRLEARWAAFFDLLKWQWNYEPVDLPGWIPDFSIGIIGTLVEVKPFIRAEQWEETAKKIAKAMDAGDRHNDVVLLGESPLWHKEPSYGNRYGFVIGWILLQDFEWTHMPYPEKASADCRTLNAVEGGWVNRITGNESGKDAHPYDTTTNYKEMWADACNLTQWRK